MKKSIFSMAAIAMLLVGSLSACTEKSPYPGYEKNESGLYYQFFTQNTGELPNVNDLLDVAISCCVNDTTFIIPATENTMQLVEPLFKGDIFEGMAMMHKGDSASFIVNIDSTFVKMFHQPTLPEEFKSTDVMRFEVRLDDFYPESEYPARMAAKVKAAADEKIAKMKSDHPEETQQAAQDLAAFLEKNKIDAQPTESGLIYVMTQEGNGEKPEAGQMVQVHYTGRLLDGKVFDSSVERGEPISIPIGMGRVIPGWDEGIQMMSKGETGILYIPYYLAYGERDMGEIPPFSNLVFEVELVDFQ